MDLASDDRTTVLAEVRVRRGEEANVHLIEDGAYLLIGSSDVCGIKLRDPSLAPIHCALRFENSAFSVEDWNSEQGVYVDGRRIETEAEVLPNRPIRIGEYVLEVGLSEEPAENSPPTDLASEATPLPELNSPTQSASRSERRQEEADQVKAEYDFGAGDETPFEDDPRVDAIASENDPDTVALLRAEIEQLQYEIAERDAQIAELTDWYSENQEEDDEESNDALLSRLEELLRELEHHDERGAMLEQFLQAAEEKQRADQDERRQLSEWIDDIESRLGEREAEWRAECDSLSHRVKTLLVERDQLMQQLAAPTNETQSSRPSEADRAQQVELRRQIHELQETNAGLEQQVRELDKQLHARSEAEAALREEHLKLAQERASLARQQAELATVSTGAEDAAASRPETEIDCKLREFRHHLREIHEQEQQTPRNLTTRIKDLWTRIEAMG